MAETKWVGIAEADLSDYQVDAIIQALKKKALGKDQADPFTKVMTNVVTTVRIRLQNKPTNVVSTELLTVPPELKEAVIWLIIERMQARLGALPLTDDQKKLLEDGKTLINRVCDPDKKDVVSKPSSPLNPPEVQRNSGVSYSVGKRRRELGI